MAYQKRETLEALKLNLQNIYDIADKSNIEEVKTIAQGFQIGYNTATKEFKIGRAGVFKEFCEKTDKLMMEVEREELFNDGWGVF